MTPLRNKDVYSIAGEQAPCYSTLPLSGQLDGATHHGPHGVGMGHQ